MSQLPIYQSTLRGRGGPNITLSLSLSVSLSLYIYIYAHIHTCIQTVLVQLDVTGTLSILRPEQNKAKHSSEYSLTLRVTMIILKIIILLYINNNNTWVAPHLNRLRRSWRLLSWKQRQWKADIEHQSHS